MTGRGLYVHVPFCRRRCPYCGFYAETGRQDQLGRYVRAVAGELRQRAAVLGWEPLSSVFFGGGTPSLLAPHQVGLVLAEARRHPGLRQDAEITLEANPTAVEEERFAGFRDAGVNRLSLGAQSFDDGTLRWLGRAHTAADVQQAYAAARRAGFESVNLDLLVGVPQAPAQALSRTLEATVALRPEHVSVYVLTVEPDTALARRVEAESVRLLDEEGEAEAYTAAAERLVDAGYEQYEVSNFARPGRRCRHNWSCWQGVEYLGVGPAAHSLVGTVRSWNDRSLDGYLAAVERAAPAPGGQETLGPQAARDERVWLGLRTCGGVALTAAEAAAVQDQPRLEALQEAGLLRRQGHRLLLGKRGWLVADAVAAEVAQLLDRRVPIPAFPTPAEAPAAEPTCSTGSTRR